MTGIYVPSPPAAPACCGAKVTSTVTDWPRLMMVPGVGRPVAVNGAAGAATEVTVSGVVPPLVISIALGSAMPIRRA
jgi:hypothetical protein